MNYFWLDANACAKRYVAERGTPLVNHLFACVPLARMVCLFEGTGEVISVFVRRRNEGKITTTRFNQLRQNFEAEFINRAEVEQVFPTEDQIILSWELIEKHSLNSTDAIILQCTFDKAIDLRIAGHNLVLVSSDKRLLRAARNKRLFTFDPETNKLDYLKSLINS